VPPGSEDNVPAQAAFFAEAASGLVTESTRYA
jgi:hypothetical protein